MNDMTSIHSMAKIFKNSSTQERRIFMPLTQALTFCTKTKNFQPLLKSNKQILETFSFFFSTILNFTDG